VAGSICFCGEGLAKAGAEGVGSFLEDFRVATKMFMEKKGPFGGLLAESRPHPWQSLAAAAGEERAGGVVGLG